MDQLNDSQIKELAKSLTSKEAAQEILHNFLPLLHTRLQSSNTGLRHRRIDLLSRALLSSDFKQWLPIETSGDGSCLYNAVSLSLVGDESLSALLRMLTVSELFANAEFYANHPQIKEFASASGYTNSAIISIFLSEQKSLATYNGDCSKVVQAIQVLAQETAEPSVYSRQFHILSLASVVGKPIFSAYPDIQSAWAIKLACHGYFYPRDVFASDVNPETLKNDAIFVMWTRNNRIPLLGWEPNHFVLLKEANSIPLTKSYAQVVASGKPNIAAYSTFPSKQTTGNTTYATPSKKTATPDVPMWQNSTDPTSPTPARQKSTNFTPPEKHAKFTTPPTWQNSSDSTTPENQASSTTPLAWRKSTDPTSPKKRSFTPPTTPNWQKSTNSTPHKKHATSTTPARQKSTNFTPSEKHAKSTTPPTWANSSDSTPPEKQAPSTTPNSPTSTNPKPPKKRAASNTPPWQKSAGPTSPKKKTNSHSEKLHFGIYSTPRVRRVKRGSSTGKHSEDKRKLDEKENNRPMKNKNLLSFFTKQKKRIHRSTLGKGGSGVQNLSRRPLNERRRRPQKRL